MQFGPSSKPYPRVLGCLRHISNRRWVYSRYWLTSGTPAVSGDRPANFGVVQWVYVHQQSGSVAEYVKLVQFPVIDPGWVPLGAILGIPGAMSLYFACALVSLDKIVATVQTVGNE